MTIKVKETIANDSETSAVFDLGLSGVSAKAAKDIKRDVADFFVESILDAVAEGRSPVSGERFPALSKAYKKKKLEDGAPGIPNLDLKGDLLESLSYKITEEGFKLGFFGEQAPKADGHLKFSGKEGTAPKRRAIPAEGQKFKADIQSEAEAMIAEALSDSIEPAREDFEGLESSREFWSVAKDTWPGLSRSEIAITIQSNSRLRQFFDELDLLRFIE